MTGTPDPWKDITKPQAGHLTARRGGSIWYAMDDVGCPHILIPIGRDQPTSQLFATRGLTAEVAELAPEGGPRGNWIDVACVDPTTRDSFTLLANEIAEEIRNIQGVPRDTVVNVLERWRWFWSSRTDPKPLSAKAALGLFAELWFLRYWIGQQTAVRWWRGPLGDRHDFVHPDISVEVKAATVSGDSNATHHITHIDQLGDPGTGSLMFFSLAVSLDTLAMYSLTWLVDNVDLWMQNTAYSQLWRGRLLHAGWNPSYADRYLDTYRIVHEDLYRVDEDFPRIIRSALVAGDLPDGVSDLKYSVAPGFVASTHRVASEPDAARDVLAPMRTSFI